MTFQKHHAELKEKKLATLQEKLEIKRRGIYNVMYVIVIDQFPRFVCSIEARIPRAKPKG